ncbi:Dock6 protein [Aphelenchoides avenae]|nr:Dock6 protein [Aphelenchus avenae]
MQGTCALTQIPLSDLLESDKLSDEDLLKMLVESRKLSSSSRLSRLKSFPIEFKFQLTLVDSEDLPAKLSPELLPMEPYAPDGVQAVTKSVLHFPRPGSFTVNSYYRNLLYIHPKSLNMSARAGNARNIAVRVELRNAQLQPLDVLFGKPPGNSLVSKRYTSVLYHNSRPVFSDELKAQLPMDLSEGHHLLFTFYHISCKPGKPNESVENVIGYTWHPLYKNGELQTGDFGLPISLDPLPASIIYLSPRVNLPNMKWLDGHKLLFNVSINAVSTVHPQDQYLTAFFNAYHSLRATDEKHELSKACFETMCQLVKVGTMLLDGSYDDHGRSQLLLTYVHYNKTTSSDSLQQAPASTLSARPVETSAPAPSASLRRRNVYESETLMEVIRNYEKQNSTKLLATSEDIGEHNRRLMHEELAEKFVTSTGTVRETACTYSWFVLELMIKAMVEYLSMCNRQYLPRKMRFREAFLDNVTEVSRILTQEVVERAAKDHRHSRFMNTSLAFFMRDALSILDRTFVAGLLRQYNREMAHSLNSVSDSLQTSLMVLKLEFMRIVCSHEHFAIHNIPFDVPTSANAPPGSGLPTFKTSTSMTAISNASSSSGSSSERPPGLHHSASAAHPPAPPSPSGSSSLSSRCSSHTADAHSFLDLTTQYRSKHFFLGIVLSDLASVLNSSNQILQAKAIGLLRTLLSTHEADSRLTDGSLKNRVAALYLPLIGIVLDVRDSLFDPYGGLTGRSRMQQGPGVNPKVTLASPAIESDRYTPPRGTYGSTVRAILPKELSRELLSCFAWVLRNIDCSTLLHYLREFSPQRVHQFVDVLQLCVSSFEHKPLQDTLSDRCSATGADFEDDVAAVVGRKQSDTSSIYSTAFDERAATTTTAKSSTANIRWRMDENVLRRSSTNGRVEDTEFAIERHLATEVNFTVLDTMETLLKVLCMPASDHLLFVLPTIIRLLMHMLACNQSVQALESIFTTQRAVAAKFPELIFEQRTELCSELCLQLLRHLASKLPAVRSQAAASLYLLMRHSFERSYGFSKVKMQVTMSLSTLVSNASSYGFLLDEKYLRRSLKTTLTYLESDMRTNAQLRSTSFSEQVKDLVFNLHMILSDTVKMQSFEDDFDMILDLMYRIAKGYQNNPDLRLTWLINIANKHADRENFAEAAQCMLHCAALVAEYMSMHDYGSQMPNGAVAFAELSDNVEEECAVSDDVISPDEEGICESSHFSVDGFMHLLGKSAIFFDRAQMYEHVATVYKFVIPILEDRKDYSRLAQVHQQISDILKRVEPPVAVVTDIADAFASPLSSSDKRCFGTYFRVGFYGSRFGDLNGEEFIYKEPAITKLSEISHRLENFYSDRFGRGVVEVIKDSNDVDVRRLKPDKAYLQITYVEPYLEVWEKRRRSTHLQRNYKVNRFIYSTPFTKDGKAHGDLKDQYKRKTVLCTQHSFPYLKTRLRVIQREQVVVLSPIEVAIEDIQKKTRELSAATVCSPPDPKMLQMVLQGCIGTTVNQGPLQMAKVFLANMVVDERGKPKDRLQNKLRLCFKDFSKKCADALQMNEQLILSDQADYQKELRKNYADFVTQLSQVIGANRPEKLLQLHTHTAHALAVAADIGPVSAV